MTSNNLVPVFTGQLQDQTTTLCNARDLHATLESGQEFANWIKNRIEQYGFTDGEDYLIKLSNRSDGRGGKRRTDYHLTLDMAKELAMVENNDKGRQVRRYFIEIEKKAKAPAITQAPALPSPNKITPNLRTRINKKAHALALEQYDTIHDLVETLVVDNLRCGATEPACEDYIERFGSSMGGVTLVNTCDLYQLARQTTGLLDKAGEALAVIHRLEKHTGMELYHRQGVTGLPDSLCKTVLGMIQQ